jgi:hypothetical protein
MPRCIHKTGPHCTHSHLSLEFLSNKEMLTCYKTCSHAIHENRRRGPTKLRRAGHIPHFHTPFFLIPHDPDCMENEQPIWKRVSELVPKTGWAMVQYSMTDSIHTTSEVIYAPHADIAAEIKKTATSRELVMRGTCRTNPVVKHSIRKRIDRRRP